MRALVQRAPRALEVVDIEDPAPGRGEVVVRTSAVGICGSDLKVWDIAAYGTGVVLGHEVAGVVEEVGDGVDESLIGTRAAVHGGISCGECQSCLDDLPYYCMSGLGLGGSNGIGGLAERVVVPATNVLPISDSTDLAAASFAEPLANGLRLLDRPEVPGTHGALIIGAGPIGLVSLLAARARGVTGIVVVEGRRRRAEAALRLGAERVISPHDDIEHEVRRSFPGGPPIVIEAVGHPATVMQAMKLTRPGGSAFLMGVCGEPVRVNPFRWMTKELTIRTSIGTDLDRHAEATRLIDTGEVDASSLITSRISLDEAPDAFEALAGGADEIKVVVEHER